MDRLRVENHTQRETGRVVNEEAIFSTSGASAGVGLAVPIHTVNRVVPQLIARGKYIRPGLGIAVDEGLNRKHGAVIVAIDGRPSRVLRDRLPGWMIIK